MRRRQFVKTAVAAGAGLLMLLSGASASTKNEMEVQPPTGPTLLVGANAKYRECTDDQPAPTQRYGINISNAECKDNEIRQNLLRGNAAGPINDQGTTTAITR